MASTCGLKWGIKAPSVGRGKQTIMPRYDFAHCLGRRCTPAYQSCLPAALTSQTEPSNGILITLPDLGTMERTHTPLYRVLWAESAGKSVVYIVQATMLVIIQLGHLHSERLLQVGLRTTVAASTEQS